MAKTVKFVVMKIVPMIDTFSIWWKQKLNLGIKPACLSLFAIGLSITFMINACSLGQTQSLKPLRIGLITWPGTDIILYAQQASKIFKQRGLEIEIVRFPSTQDIGPAVMRGGIDAGLITLWDAMQVYPGNGKPLVLMTADVSAGSDGIVSRTEIKSVKNLRGKKVSAKLGVINHLVLLEALKVHQIKPLEVQILDYSNDVAVQKLKAGQIDAAVMWEPILGETAQSIKGNVIHTTKDVDSLAIDILMSSDTIVKSKQAELKQFMLAWFDVMHAVDTKPTEVFEVVGKKLGQSSQSFASDYAGLKKGDIALNKRMFAVNGRLNSAKTEIVQLLQSDPRHGRVIRQDVEFDATLVNKAIAEWKP